MAYSRSEYQKYFQAAEKYTQKHIDTDGSVCYNCLSVCLSVKIILPVAA